MVYEWLARGWANVGTWLGQRWHVVGPTLTQQIKLSWPSGVLISEILIA